MNGILRIILIQCRYAQWYVNSNWCVHSFLNMHSVLTPEVYLTRSLHSFRWQEEFPVLCPLSHDHWLCWVCSYVQRRSREVAYSLTFKITDKSCISQIVFKPYTLLSCLHGLIICVSIAMTLSPRIPILCFDRNDSSFCQMYRFLLICGHWSMLCALYSTADETNMHGMPADKCTAVHRWGVNSILKL